MKIDPNRCRMLPPLSHTTITFAINLLFKGVVWGKDFPTLVNMESTHRASCVLRILNPFSSAGTLKCRRIEYGSWLRRSH